jgi:predicted TIM-barrel fold metal-dependent hydrolase
VRLDCSAPCRGADLLIFGEPKVPAINGQPEVQSWGAMLLEPRSNDEFVAPPATPVAAEATRRALATALRLGLSRREFLRSAFGTAVALAALSACDREERRANRPGTGAGGRFDLPEEAGRDPDAAAEALAPDPGEVVVDVQTHFLDPDTIGFGRRFPQANCGAEARLCFTIDRWADLVLGSSDTALAVLSAIPVLDSDNPMSIAKMEDARRLADTLCGADEGRASRVRLQGEAFPQYGRLPAALERMTALAADHRIVAWKTYTHIGAGYALTDPVGEAFLAHVEALAAEGTGPRIVCVHKGFGADPADLGPAAAAHPELTFVAYHSGFEADVTEGPYTPDGAGVDRFVRTLAEASIGPGGNVYAELGSTWRAVLSRPAEAAHTLGKLLAAVGPERILWGTDSIWYGSPQDQIEAFRVFAITPEYQERFGYPPLDVAAKRAILGANAARLHGLDLAALAGGCRPARGPGTG